MSHSISTEGLYDKDLPSSVCVDRTPDLHTLRVCLFCTNLDLDSGFLCLFCAGPDLDLGSQGSFPRGGSARSV